MNIFYFNEITIFKDTQELPQKNVWIYADIRGYNVVQILFQLSEIRIHKNYIRMPIRIRW